MRTSAPLSVQIRVENKLGIDIEVATQQQGNVIVLSLKKREHKSDGGIIIPNAMGVPLSRN